MICGEDAEGAKCDDCGKALCGVCIVQRGVALCEDCDVLDEADDDTDFCVECGDTFRYDDCGGYNPPCACGLHCRHCHDAETREIMRDQDDFTEEDDHDPL